MLVQLSVIRDAVEINRCFEPFFKLVDASRSSVLVQDFCKVLRIDADASGRAVFMYDEAGGPWFLPAAPRLLAAADPFLPSE